MNTNPICPQCKAPLPSDAPQGLCPRCLLKTDAPPGASGGPATIRVTPAPAPTPAEIGRHFPQLEIIELIGEGGMGVVYKARQPNLDRIVALKILPAEAGRDAAFAERFSREAKALAKLNHPGIVAIYDFGHAGPFYYFLMEFVDGVNLRQMIGAKQVQPRDALNLVMQVCEALQFAHDQGVVHRDIKPGNILVNLAGKAKIADFGLAKLLDPAAVDFTLTGAHHVMGTPDYMAPEQRSHPLDVDHRADIYSLGVVLYELLTGELPLGRFAPPSQKVQVDVRVDEVVLRTLESEPGRRYQHASDVRTDVQNITGGTGAVPPGFAGLLGFEYRSPTTLFGLPLVHIVAGMDPATGRPRVARGIVAIGNVAKGVVAFGGVALGGLAFGGVSVGLVAVGGVGLGVVSLGGLALGLALAFGGLAVAPVAVGGMAVGYYAFGGGAYGAHALGGNARDAVAQQFFGPDPRRLMNTMNFVVMTLGALACLVPILGTFWARNQVRAGKGAASSQNSKRDGLRELLVGLALVAAVVVGLAVPFWWQGEPIVIRETPPNFGHFTRDSRVSDYAVEAPVNHRVNFWLEWWQDGQRVTVPAFELADSFTPARGRAFKGYLDFIITNPRGPSPSATNLIEWHWGLRGGDALSGRRGRSPHPFAGLSLTDSSYGHQPVRKLKAGKEVTLLVVRGDRERLEGQPWDPKVAGRADMEMHLKVRVDAVPEGELREGPQSSTNIPPVAAGAARR